ncbi:MAG: SagB/ThcOx family dehydrogenase [Candidatus Omnitrophica bacterium]|nr:SagB/ThcOx family dehydrogenase [Candidatus Omnitrophota bacterium]
MAEIMKEMKLPEPRIKGGMSVEESIRARRSVRNYSSREISLDDISQLLWAAQGVTDKSRGLRSAPSAGALYPLEVYVAKKDGLFHYLPDGHKLELISTEDLRKGLSRAAYGQSFVEEAPVDIIICAVYERVTSRYGERGIRYTDMEAGHAAENVFLQAAALGLSSVAVGAFTDAAVAKVLNLPKDVKPLYVLPVGYKR